MNPEAKQARLERAFKQLAIPEAAALLPVLDELAARPGLMWRYDTELGIRASCTTATPTITTGRAGLVGDAWTDDGEPDHLCPVALIAMGTEAETAEHLQEPRDVRPDLNLEAGVIRSGVELDIGVVRVLKQLEQHASGKVPEILDLRAGSKSSSTPGPAPWRRRHRAIFDLASSAGPDGSDAPYFR